jgi:predicted DNA-binding protein (MmcQ/YjbR family)
MPSVDDDGVVNPSSLDPQHLHQLRTVCLAFPEATEKPAWGDPSWRIRDRIFAMQKGNYDGGRPSLWLKAPAGAAEVLVSSDQDRFFVPPYVGQKGWIGVYLDSPDLDWEELGDLITDSYRLIAPKRLVAGLDKG